MRGHGLSFLACAVIGFAALAAPAARAAVITPVGSPTWTVTDTHLFAAPVGNPGNGYADFGTTIGQILPPPNHVPHPQLGTGPGAAHAGPYNNEFGANIAAAGYVEKTTFSAAEWGGDLGVWFTTMVIPNGSTTGSSPDFASGPILPNNIYPFTYTATTYRNGVVYDVTPAYPVPALNDPSLTPAFNVDGASHQPFFLVDNASFGTDPTLPLTGNYEFRISIRDARDQGYDLVQSFSVVPNGTGPAAAPLPPGVWTGLVTAAVGAVPAAVRRRRRAR